MSTPNEPIKQISTLEMLEYCEKKPHEVFTKATAMGLEISPYLDRITKNDGEGSRTLSPFRKNLQKHKLATRAAKGHKPALVGDFLLGDDEPSAKRSYRRMLWHEAVRLHVEETLNAHKPMEVTRLMCRASQPAWTPLSRNSPVALTSPSWCAIICCVQQHVGPTKRKNTPVSCLNCRI